MLGGFVNSIRNLLVLTLMLVLSCSVWAAKDPGVFDLSEAKKLGAEFTVKKLEFTGPSDPADAYALEIRFSPMSREQFDGLMKAYGGPGLVPYSSKARYELSDFLPPVVQALIGFRFPAMIEKNIKWVKKLLEDVDGESSIYTQSNCYSTVWEVVRSQPFKSPADKGVFCLFWEGEYVFNEEICKEKYGKVIGADDLRSGDVVLFFNRINDEYRSLMHAAIFVDKGLYFEKTDSFDEYAWRFVFYADMSNKLQKLADPGKMEVEFRRFNGTFPHPAKVFSVIPDSKDIPKKDWGKLIMADQPGLGGKSCPAPYRIGEVEIIIDQQLGRGIISPKSPYRANFKELPWKAKAK